MFNSFLRDSKIYRNVSVLTPNSFKAVMAPFSRQDLPFSMKNLCCLTRPEPDIPERRLNPRPCADLDLYCQKVCAFLGLLYKIRWNPGSLMHLSTLCISLGQGESQNDDYFLLFVRLTHTHTHTQKSLDLRADRSRMCLCAHLVLYFLRITPVVLAETCLFHNRKTCHAWKFKLHLLVSVHACNPLLAFAEVARTRMDRAFELRYASVALTPCRRSPLLIAATWGGFPSH